MDRLERLLNLVHVLQSAAEPVTMQALREQFPDYASGSAETSRRKIERDKAELAGIGMVIEYVSGDDERPAGYVLDIEASYLPELELDDADRALLATAARAALDDPGLPHRAALRLALAKLGAESAPPVPLVFHHAAAPDDEGRVEKLGAALDARKRVRLRYAKPGGPSADREIEPYGLFLKRGAWFLGGRDVAIDALRVFRVSRIEHVEVSPARPTQPDFEVPEGFDLKRMAVLDPLRFEVHEPVVASVRVDPEVAFLAERAWGPPAEDGTFEITTTNVDTLLDQVLGFGLRAELLAPDSARRALAEILRDVLAAHGEGSAST